MAIKRSDVGRLSPEDHAYLQAAEIYIDGDLIREFRGTSPAPYATVRFDEIRGAADRNEDPNHLVLEVLKSMYEEAGWKVEIVHDQRDGDFIQFS